jgi:anti-anti-sigma regulatory factor
MHMTEIAVWRNIDRERVVPSLREAGENLDQADGEVVLDFSSVCQMDVDALRAMDEFAGMAEAKSVKVVLRGVNIDVYRVLKLVKLTSRFTFINW